MVGLPVLDIRPTYGVRSAKFSNPMHQQMSHSQVSLISLPHCAAPPPLTGEARGTCSISGRDYFKMWTPLQCPRETMTTGHVSAHNEREKETEPQKHKALHKNVTIFHIKPSICGVLWLKLFLYKKEERVKLWKSSKAGFTQASRWFSLNQTAISAVDWNNADTVQIGWNIWNVVYVVHGFP